MNNSCIKEHGSRGCSTGLTVLSTNNKLIAYYLKYEPLFISCWYVCWGGGWGVLGASCNKLHGASCNIGEFINFVESVRPKKAIPHTDYYGCWMLYRRCASNWYRQAFSYLHRKFKIKSKWESWSWSYFKFASGHIKQSQTSHLQ